MANRPAVALCIPAHRDNVHVHHVYQTACITTYAHVNGLHLGIVTIGAASIDWARNFLLWQAIRTGAKWALMCDSDNFTTDAPGIFRMIDEGERRGAAVIAAPVLMRNRPNARVIVGERQKDGSIVERIATLQELAQGRVVPFPGYNVVQIDENGNERLAEPEELEGKVERVSRIGSAFSAINLGWICKHWPEGPWFLTHQRPWRPHESEPSKRIGEDFYFSDGVRERGGFLYSDGRLKIAHADATSEIGVVVDHIDAKSYEAAASLLSA